MIQRQMQVVYASNEGYVRHLGTSLCSLWDKNRSCPSIQVYVLSMGITKESQSMLNSLAQRYGRSLNFVALDDLRQRLGEIETGSYDVSVMLRLFMGEVLPEVKRVLYLDCDTIVARPLGKLWNTDLQGRVMGAVMEPTIYPKVKEMIGLGEQEPYYNSGVLLVDLERWRSERIQERVLEFWREKGEHLFASDQDVLNGVLKGRILTLPAEYNFFTNYRYFSYRTLTKRNLPYRTISREEFARAKRHPAIIHYMGDERPWIAGNFNHYRKAYEHYLAQTPWADYPREEGKRLYMLAYHMLDYITVVCPPVRWAISRRLGMKLTVSMKKGRERT